MKRFKYIHILAALFLLLGMGVPFPFAGEDGS